MDDDYLVARATALSWRWRCEAEGVVFPGYDLRVVDVHRGSLLPLAESGLPEIERGKLRHTCGNQADSQRLILTAFGADFLLDYHCIERRGVANRVGLRVFQVLVA
jgi:hypothetical protein